MLALRLALRDLRGGLRGFRILMACLVLGVAAIAAIGSVRAAIEAGLAREGAALLGGDAAIEFSYRFASDTERAWMDETAERVSETVDFRSMLVVSRDGSAERALTQVKAVDDAYPLVGAVTLDPPMPLAQALSPDGPLPGIVVERALSDRLGLHPGDTLRLGTQDFTLSAVLASYPDNAEGGFGLGPRSLVLTQDLAQSGLITPGTLYSTEYRLDLPEGADLAATQSEAETQFSAAGMRWRDARAGAPGIATFVDRLGAFLVLVGLSGLAVGGVGVFSAVRAYLDGKMTIIATLKTLGATRGRVLAVYGLQIALIALASTAIGLVLGAGLPLIVAPFIAQALPLPAEFGLYAKPLVEAALYGLLAAAIFSLWPLARATETGPAALYRDGGQTLRLVPRPRYVMATLALVAALIVAAVLFSGSWRLSLWTFGGILAALAVLALAALGVARLARLARRRVRGWPGARAALAAIGARGGETSSVILSLGLGLSVLAAVGQIDGTLRGAIEGQLPQVAPSYFVVDIQPSQIAEVKARMTSDPAVSRFQAAPMLRGVITRINGQPAADIAGDHWVLQGDRGVTYSDQMPPGTTLTEGRWWPQGYDGPGQISFAAEEAAEMGLTLGDEITVNILGRDISAQITSFREVAFETAGIGFVMSMSPNALRGAPHSWIATIYADAAAEGRILRDLAGDYPNITAIRVKDGIDRAGQLLGGIADATRYGALITLLTGALVLIGAALAGERARTYEAAILRSLGATRGEILRSFALRGALTGLAAGLVALAAGIAGGWAVARYVMQVDFAVIWPNALIVVLGGMGANLLAGLYFALRPLRQSPAQVLRAQD